MTHFSLVIVPILELQHAPLPTKCYEPKSVPNFLSFYCFHIWTHSWVYQRVWGCVILGGQKGIPILRVNDSTNVSFAFDFVHITKLIVHCTAHLNLEAIFLINQKLVANHINLKYLDPIMHYTSTCKNGGQYIYFECGHLSLIFLKNVHVCCFDQLYVYNVICNMLWLSKRMKPTMGVLNIWKNKFKFFKFLTRVF